MKNYYFFQRKLISLGLMAVGLISFTAHSQCTAVATLSEDFQTLKKWPGKCWSGSDEPFVDVMGLPGGNVVISMFSFNKPTDLIYLITPELSTINGKNVFKFDIIAGSTIGITAQIGTMSNNKDFSTFVAAEPAFTVTGPKTYTSAPIKAINGHKYVAIKLTPTANAQSLNIDNVEWNTTAGTHTFDLSKVHVYPNPTSGTFRVDSQLDIKQIEVYNSVGQRILVTDEKEINLQNAANGLYIVTVTAADGGQGTYKLVKE